MEVVRLDHLGRDHALMAPRVSSPGPASLPSTKPSTAPTPEEEVDELASDYEDESSPPLVLPPDQTDQRLNRAQITVQDTELLKDKLEIWSTNKRMSSSTTSLEPW